MPDNPLVAPAGSALVIAPPLLIGGSGLSTGGLLMRRHGLAGTAEIYPGRR
jgi:hypothetical protein